MQTRLDNLSLDSLFAYLNKQVMPHLGHDAVVDLLSYELAYVDVKPGYILNIYENDNVIPYKISTVIDHQSGFFAFNLESTVEGYKNYFVCRGTSYIQSPSMAERNVASGFFTLDNDWKGIALSFSQYPLFIKLIKSALCEKLEEYMFIGHSLGGILSARILEILKDCALFEKSTAKMFNAPYLEADSVPSAFDKIVSITNDKDILTLFPNLKRSEIPTEIRKIPKVRKSVIAAAIYYHKFSLLLSQALNN